MTDIDFNLIVARALACASLQASRAQTTHEHIGRLLNEPMDDSGTNLDCTPVDAIAFLIQDTGRRVVDLGCEQPDQEHDEPWCVDVQAVLRWRRIAHAAAELAEEARDIADAIELGSSDKAIAIAEKGKS